MSCGSLQEFNDVWDDLADQCRVDGRGGCEYSRVLTEWVAADQPTLTHAWVWSRANMRSDGTYPSMERYPYAATKAAGGQ